MTKLFTYGTLMDPQVWTRVAEEVCPAVPAVLYGYEARRLEGFTFPGLVECPGGVTRGLLYSGVSAEAMARLDAYEDDFYDRVPLTVEPAGGIAEVAEVYVIGAAFRDIVRPEIWVPPS